MAASYTEDFNGADKAGVGYDYTWTEEAGTSWDNNSNRARGTSVNDYVVQIVLIDEETDTDYQRAEATMVSFALTGGGDFFGGGLVINAADSAQTFLFFQARSDNQFRLFYANAGSFTQLDSVAQTPQNGDLLRIERDGADVFCYINDIEVMSATLNGTQEGVLAGRLRGGFVLSGHPSGSTIVLDDYTFEDFDQSGGGPDYTLDADQGSYTLTGQSAALLAARRLTADAGSYSVSGQSAGLLAGRKLEAATGSYSLSGQSANLIVSRLLTAAQGNYTLSGQAANLLVGRLLSAAQGTYILSGQDVTLTYSGEDGPDYTLTAETGSYALSGQAVSLIVNRLLSVDQGIYSLSGQAANLLFGRLLSAGAGSYTVSGQAAGLLVSRLLTANQGSYSLNGQTVTLVYSGSILPITPDSRVFVIAAEDRVYVIVAEDRVLAVH